MGRIRWTIPFYNGFLGNNKNVKNATVINRVNYWRYPNSDILRIDFKTATLILIIRVKRTGRKAGSLLFHLSLFLYQAQNLPSLSFLSIDIADLSRMQDACHVNFVIDVAHRGVSVVQWKSIGVRNPKVWGSIPHGDSECFLCPTLVTRRKNIFP